jgi:hypothetical protein
VASRKSFVYTDLSVKRALTLEIAGVEYEVAQYTASWAPNEIPTAACMLAIGRDAATQLSAAIHRRGVHDQMTKARVWFRPGQEYSPNSYWPEGARVIFEGYFTGFALRKVNGKMHVVANLLHWLVNLAFSSCVTKNGHTANPTQLNAAAVIESLRTTQGEQGNYVAALAPAQLIADNVRNDLWGSIKTLFCALAGQEGLPTGPESACEGSGDFSANHLAVEALRRIEGPTFDAPSAERASSILEAAENAAAQAALAAAGSVGAARAAGAAVAAQAATAAGLSAAVEPTGNLAVDAAVAAAVEAVRAARGCGLEYKWGVPLAMDTLGIDAIEFSIAMAIGHETVESWAGTSFWEKLVGHYCPMFGMAVVPMIDTALVIADTPALAGAEDVYWKEITPDEYDADDLTRELHRPLRAVGVLAEYNSQTMGGMSQYADDLPVIGGCYSEDSVRPGDGVTLYVRPPSWLEMLGSLPLYASDVTGVGQELAGRTATTPASSGAATTNTPDTFGVNANRLYSRYAHTVYVNNILRGNGCSVSGKLRFDIAPCSIIKLQPSQERFLPQQFVFGSDDLAVTVYGAVNRVTVSINAEAGMAGTTFTLTHVRTESENKKRRNSVTAHPLFGTAIHGDPATRLPLVGRVVPGGRHGSPLKDDYNLP